MAARTAHSSEVQLLKLVHNLLPTREHVSKFQPWTVPQCHHCIEIDTLDHLQRSKCNPVSLQYPTDIHEAICTYFDRHNTPASFRTTFLHSLESWLQSSESVDTQSPEWNGSVALQRDQQAIGWRLLTREMLSKHWHTLLLQSLHNDHWRHRHTDVPEHTEASCPKLISIAAPL